jgi:hypothetical protein
MADPTVFDSQLSNFKITDTGSVERDITDFIVSIDGLPGPRELSEATTLNRSARAFHPSLENAVITLELVYSEDALVGSDTVLGPLRTHTAAVAFKYYPRGTSGKYYSGSVWVRNYAVLTRIGDIVRSRCELQANTIISRT